VDDIRHGNIRPTTIRRDWRDIKDFFLNEERRQRISQMKWYKRWFFQIFWLFKSLFLKLPPLRRLLLILSLFLILISGSIGINNLDVRNVIGIIILLFILMLELKDKLLAHNELEAGRVVQNALLPQKSPKIKGWDIWLYTRPANEVGGDLVDYISLDRYRLGVVLADIAGKGLGAALHMAKLQATLRALAPDFKSLESLGKKINEIFYRDTSANCFASLIYVELNSKSGEIRLLNAGHFPPLLRKSDMIDELPKGSSALGLSSGTNYSEQLLKLQQNEFLLIYSDGLTEARNEKGQFFGEESVRTVLSDVTALNARKICESLIDNVDQFTGKSHQNDDLSLVIIKRQS
jgi:serine phosphatase RsbU (regulator of sigma subunit)